MMSRWHILESGIELNHTLRKLELGAEASTFRGWRKLVGAYFLDLLKAMLVHIAIQLQIVVCAMAGLALGGLFIWFVLFY